jgi:hypothetical protein
LHFENLSSTLTNYRLTIDPSSNQTAMKTRSFHYSNFPLKVNETGPVAKEKTTARLLQRTDLSLLRFTIIKNKSIEDPCNWDSSWFASYE